MYGAAHLEGEVNFDDFAVSLPDFLVFDVGLERASRTGARRPWNLGKV